MEGVREVYLHSRLLTRPYLSLARTLSCNGRTVSSITKGAVLMEIRQQDGLSTRCATFRFRDVLVYSERFQKEI